MAPKRPNASRLQADLAHRILRHLQDQGAEPGHHLVELDLCRIFDVSRTPVRGALKLLAADGVVAERPGRGYALVRLPAILADEEPASEAAEDARLFEALADARARGAIPDQFTQQDAIRRFQARLGSVMRVLRQLAELGVAMAGPLCRIPHAS